MSLLERPMLAGTVEDFSKIKFPVLTTRKIDGIRCVKIDGQALSRTFKPIPNKYINSAISKSNLIPDNIDGELSIIGAEFNEVSSCVMREEGLPNFEYLVFDYILDDPKKPYNLRMKDLAALKLPSFCVKILPKLINNLEELEVFERECLADGAEGIMIRSLDSPYKFGRSTEKEGWLLKIKRFKDAEARITDFVEAEENLNPKELDNFGNSKRSSHKDGKVFKGTLGKFIVEGVNGQFKGKTFGIGTGRGLTQELRQQIWDNRKKYLNQIIKYKYQEIGTVDLPRLPIFLGFRSEIDI